MDMNNMEILAPFQPPHMDIVTGLAVVGDKMISGSKDKNLRLWSLDHSVGSLKNTTHAFNDYVTAVQSQNEENLGEGAQYYPIFYAGSKDGQIKVGSTKDDRIDFLGSILAHTQAVNAISLLEDNNIIVSASGDKTIKLWKPTPETVTNL
jgi:WD40 repeat protein